MQSVFKILSGIMKWQNEFSIVSWADPEHSSEGGWGPDSEFHFCLLLVILVF